MAEKNETCWKFVLKRFDLLTEPQIGSPTTSWHVLREGRKSKENYYDMILRRCSVQPWIYKQLAIAAEKNKGILDLDYILQIAQYAKTKKSMPVDDFLTDALHTGVLIETRHPPSRYQIPMPSLGDYLRSLEQEPPPDTI